MSNPAKIWAVVPAAGVGKRVGDALPKQYLRLHHQTIIEWSLDRLLAVACIEGIVVAVSDSDEYWPELRIADHDRIETTAGGYERANSVLNGLTALQGYAADRDWVLVHDAARPCVRVSDIENLIETVIRQNQGGILAMPVRDTMKKSKENNEIEYTVNRNSLWHAFTPQMFQYGELRAALTRALDDGFAVTDESSAMEHVGHKPLLIEGHSDNIKVTLPEDLHLAAHYLTQQEKEQERRQEREKA